MMNDLVPSSVCKFCDGSNERAKNVCAGATRAIKPRCDASNIVVTRRVRLFERDFRCSLLIGDKNEFFIINIFKINVNIHG